MNIVCLMALAARKSASSTDLFVQSGLDADEAFIELWGQGVLIGYARLARVRSADEFRNGRSVATFELAELLSARSPAPGPLVSLSAVLWSRRELREELSGCRSSVQQEDSTLEPSPLSVGGECPHEA